ncbi:MAG: DUF4407 domain-containing protein [Saprospiraceae bacterium]|nr:DUF4407 domain-containing protein [Saprospiraceae bacterium]
MRCARPLWLLYNIDPSILQSCSLAEKSRLAMLGLLTLAITGFAIISGGYLCFLLTENYGLSAVLGILLGWNFLNLYRLLLITFDLPASNKSNTAVGTSFSYLLRGISLVLFFLIIIKPCELLYFHTAIDKELETVVAAKQRQMNGEWLQFLDDRISRYGNETQELEAEKQREIQFLDSHDNTFSDNEIGMIRHKIASLDSLISATEEIIAWSTATKEEYQAEFQELSQSSTHVIDRFKILFSKFPESWMITLVLGAIFLFPILIKIRAVQELEYYKREKEKAKNLIISEYHVFKESYQLTFTQFGGDEIQYYERYTDPPFNTKPKDGPNNLRDHKEFQNWVSKFL